MHIFPGILLTLGVAGLAWFLDSVSSLAFLSGSVLALFIGMFINRFRSEEDPFRAGVSFTTKRVLKAAIILLGASLDVNTILEVGRLSLGVMVFTLFTAFVIGYFVGRALGLDWKLAALINSGTGVCGGSAIAAVGPVIQASFPQIAYAMSVTFIFDMVMIILVPIFGRLMNMSDLAFGLWTGTAVNDTSSVVAAGYAFSEAAGDFAVTVKLTRTLSIIPIVIIFSLISYYQKRKAQGEGQKLRMQIKDIFPFFILGFLLLSVLRSIGWIDPATGQVLKDISKFLMVMALAGVGLSTRLSDIGKAGRNAFIHSLTMSTLVLVVALVVQYFMGIS